MVSIPKISIIAPNLNDAKHLKLFLQSIQHQTHKNHELIIVDGGSTDESLQLLHKSMAIVLIDKTRNFGYVRNLGSKQATGEILFHTSSDTYLEPTLLEKINQHYQNNPKCVALAGRTYPLGTSLFAHLGYQLFDFMRFLFTISPMPIKKFRPSGNFTTVKRETFENLGGFPEVNINEDGLFGQKFDAYLPKHHKKVMFHLGLYIGHSTKRFEAQGGIQTILFYFYTLGNLFPILKPFLKHIEKKSARVWQK